MTVKPPSNWSGDACSTSSSTLCFRDPVLPANWVPAAASASVDLGNPFVAALKRCVFVRGNLDISLDLEWREFSCNDRRDDYNAASSRSRPEVGLYVLETRVYWLQASTFGPNEVQRAKYDDAFRQLREARADVKRVVLGLRANNGGSSIWADLFAEALWDASPDDDEEDEVYLEWRVSEDNIAYWETVPPMHREPIRDAQPTVDWSNHALRHIVA